MGFAAGFSGVRVWIGNSVSPKNPYPWHGFWVTRTVTRDLPLGHQRRRLTVNNSFQQRQQWQQLNSNGKPPSPPPPPPPSPMPQDEQHNGKCAMGRMTRAGEGPSCPPPIGMFSHLPNAARRGMPLLVVFLLF